VAVTNAYCTLAQLREQFDDDATILPTALAERAINATSRAIDKHCGRRFWIDTNVATRVYRPDYSDLVWVDDIATTAGLIVKTDSAGDGTYATTWASTDYELQPLNADADGQAYCWTRIGAVDRYLFPTSGKVAPLQVTAKFGWSAIPDEVEQACIIRAAAIFKRRESISGVAGFDGFGAVRISRQRDPDVAALLDSFIRIRVGAV
jgi:hypothetical protein